AGRCRLRDPASRRVRGRRSSDRLRLEHGAADPPCDERSGEEPEGDQQRGKPGQVDGPEQRGVEEHAGLRESEAGGDSAQGRRDAGDQRNRERDYRSEERRVGKEGRWREARGEMSKKKW